MAKRLIKENERIRILLVDDSAVVRRLVKRALDPAPLFDLVGTAANGLIGLRRVAQLHPDVVLLDLEMPEMDGMQMLQVLRREHPQTRVVIHSALTEYGAAITIQALALGADDYITKTASDVGREDSLSSLRQDLTAKIKQLFKIPTCIKSSSSDQQAVASPTRPLSTILQCTSASSVKPRVLAIGVSTGGPNALSGLLSAMPADFPLPILIVQHMPPLFTKLLADRLNATCELLVEEAAHGARVRSGRVLIAPGNYHMTVSIDSGIERVFLDQTSPQNSCRPAVDVLFSSLAEAYGGAVLAVILTGMGQDGLRGARRLKERGAHILVQDEETSVVWGMPGAVANAGLADYQLPLEDIVPAILHIATQSEATNGTR